MKLIDDTLITFGTESLDDSGNAGTPDQGTQDDDSADTDFGSDEGDEGEDDTAEESLVDGQAAESQAGAFAFATEALGGLQVSLLTTAARINGVDTAADPGFVAIESLGSDVPDSSVALALEALEDHQKGAIARFVSALTAKIGKLLNLVPDLIAKIPGGETVNAVFAKAADVISCPKAQAVMAALAAALSVIGGISVSKLMEGGYATDVSEVGGLIEATKDTLAKIRIRGKILRQNAAVQRGTAAELGWTKATWTKFVSSLSDIKMASAKLLGDVERAVTMKLPEEGTAKFAGYAMRASRGLYAIVALLSFVLTTLVVMIGIRVVRGFSKAGRAAEQQA